MNGWSRDGPGQDAALGWALTGSGHFFNFKECLGLIRDLEHVDLFVSRAADEVLRMYKQQLALPATARAFRDTTASSPPVGQFYYGGYHTLIVARATSKTVAKCGVGISDSLATNVFAQAGKCRVPTIVFACDTAPELETEAPKGLVKVYPRRIDLANTELLKSFEATIVAETLDQLVAAISRRRRSWPAKPYLIRDDRARSVLDRASRAAAAKRVLAEIQRQDFEWAIVDIGVKVAALMTQAIISRRLPRPVDASRVVVPGRCRADLDQLSTEFGVRFERGADELKDLPAFLGGRARAADLSRYDIRIFVEIVDASALSVDAIVTRALGLAASGADVIDLGCLPDRPFPHLEDSIRAVKGAGLRISVDSAETSELRRGARAGADFLLSLKEDP